MSRWPPDCVAEPMPVPATSCLASFRLPSHWQTASPSLCRPMCSSSSGWSCVVRPIPLGGGRARFRLLSSQSPHCDQIRVPAEHLGASGHGGWGPNVGIEHDEEGATSMRPTYLWSASPFWAPGISQLAIGVQPGEKHVDAEER